MGEVIDMFGEDGENGPFGTSYNVQGLGAGSESEYGDPEQPPDAPQAGAPAPAVTVAQDIEGGVGMALQYARTATNRLVNIPPPGAIEAQQRKQLLETYASIEDAALDILSAARSSGAGIDLGRETTKLQEDVQSYVQTVEDTLEPYTNGQPGAGAMASGPRINWLLWGGVAAALGVAGFAVYKAQQGRP